jgi:hypothetical protein
LKPLPRIYKNKASLEQEGGKIIFRVMLSKYKSVSPSTIAKIKFANFIENMRSSKEKGAKEDASTLKV